MIIYICFLFYILIGLLFAYTGFSFYFKQKDFMWPIVLFWPIWILLPILGIPSYWLCMIIYRLGHIIYRKIFPNYPCWSFTLILNQSEISLEQMELIYKTCNDCTIVQSDNVVYLYFDRRAKNKEVAVESAIHHVEKIGLTVYIVD